MDTNALKSLIAHINSRKHLSRFLEKIDIVMRESIQTELLTRLQGTFNQQEQDYINQLNLQSKSDLGALYRELEQTPTLKIYTSISISGEAEKTISERLRESIDEAFFIEFSERQSIIGGAFIEYKGKIADYSLKSQIKKIN